MMNLFDHLVMRCMWYSALVSWTCFCCCFMLLKLLLWNVQSSTSNVS